MRKKRNTASSSIILSVVNDSWFLVCPTDTTKSLCYGEKTRRLNSDTGVKKMRPFRHSRLNFRHVRALTTFSRYHSSYLLNFFPRRPDKPQKYRINRKIWQSAPSLLSACIFTVVLPSSYTKLKGFFPQTFARFRAPWKLGKLGNNLKESKSFCRERNS